MHFIHPDTWKEAKLLPTIKQIHNRHTADNLSSMLQDAFKEWKLEGRIVAAVTDNAANMIAAVQQMNLVHFACTVHTLNLTVRESMQLASDLLERCKKIAGHFNHSIQHRQKLGEI